MSPTRRVNERGELATRDATHFQSELKRVKANYQAHVLNGLEDPFPNLWRRRLAAVAGPAGSNLFALVRIRSSGTGAYYRRVANRILERETSVVDEIRQRFLQPGDAFIVSPVRNPMLRKADGQMIRLEWHHSPNHIMTVSLIPAYIHRIVGGLQLLHVDGARGGNELFNIDARKKVGQ